VYLLFFYIEHYTSDSESTRNQKKADGVSNPLIISLIIGLSLWLIYGIVQDAVIKGANSVGVMLNFFLLTLKIKYIKS